MQNKFLKNEAGIPKFMDRSNPTVLKLCEKYWKDQVKKTKTIQRKVRNVV